MIIPDITILEKQKNNLYPVFDEVRPQMHNVECSGCCQIETSGQAKPRLPM